jgi:hypothetical protein
MSADTLSLPDAIRKGAKVTAEYVDGYFNFSSKNCDRPPVGACALGAAILGRFDDAWTPIVELSNEYPGLLANRGCPDCDRSVRKVNAAAVIVHLQVVHHRNREWIANWLEMVEEAAL